jgi:F0F1-type ATP synthase membrane subunit b/b'
MKFDASLLVIMGIFWITYWILRICLFKPVQAILEERRTTIDSARSVHEAALADANARIDAERARLTEARVAAAALRDRLRKEAEGERARLLAETKGLTEAEVGRAQAELAAAVDRERGELEGRAKMLADGMVEKLLLRETA